MGERCALKVVAVVFKIELYNIYMTAEVLNIDTSLNQWNQLAEFPDKAPAVRWESIQQREETREDGALCRPVIRPTLAHCVLLIEK